MQMLIYSACALLVLGVAGALLGRLSSWMAVAARWGTPVMLLLMLAGYVIWPDPALSLCGSLFGWDLMPAVLSVAVPVAAAAVLCAFFPNKLCFGLAALMSAYGTLGVMAALNGSGDVSYVSILFEIVASLLAFGLSWAGITGKKPVRAAAKRNKTRSGRKKASDGVENAGSVQPQTAVLQEMGGGAEPYIHSGPCGSLTVFAVPYEGQSLPMAAGEVIYIGSDANLCHLILELPGMPPCCCSVRWLENSNTYLLTAFNAGSLMLSDGTLLPQNSTIEIFSGTPFYFAPTRQPLAQAG